MSFLIFCFDFKKVAKDFVIVANILIILLNFTFFGSHCNSQSNKKVAQKGHTMFNFSPTDYRVQKQHLRVVLLICQRYNS